MSPAEEKMRKTIEFLLALPEVERRNMELAKNLPFSQESPPPPLDPVTPHRTRSALPNSASGVLEAAAATRCATLDMASVDAGADLCERGFRPAVLNFAHGYNCGGGFEHAGGSQEEDIFRKTSIFLSLWPHRRSDDGPGVLARGMWIGDFDAKLARKEPFYPHTDCAVIYSPHVRLVRNLQIPGTPLESAADVDALPVFGVLTVAAQDCGRDPPFREDLLRDKCRAALWAAAREGHDAVVLGAFGCGYFRNPPQVVAAVFKELLEGEFAGTFSIAVFAVPGVASPNYRHFAELFPPRDWRDPDWHEAA